MDNAAKHGTMRLEQISGNRITKLKLAETKFASQGHMNLKKAVI